MYHDNFLRDELEQFAEYIRTNSSIKKALISETNTVYFHMCLSDMADTAKEQHGDCDSLASLWDNEIGEWVAYHNAYKRIDSIMNNDTYDNFHVFYRMYRFIIEKSKMCHDNLGFHDNYYVGYNEAMLHIIDAFVYSYDIEFK